MAASIVSVINLKGGVGKSTLAMILGEFLAFRASQRVLLIDMDAQGNLSYCMVPESQIGIQDHENRTIYHLLRQALEGTNSDIGQFITQPPLVVSNISRSGVRSYPGVLDIVISTPNVASLDEDLLALWEAGKPMPGSVRQSLSEALEPARERYDYILIDCPPGLSLFSSTALLASDFYISPIIPEPLSLQGVSLVQNRVRELNQRYNSNVQFRGVVLNIVKHYRNTHFRIAEEIYGPQHGLYQPFSHWLPDNEKLRKLGEFEPDIPGWAGGVEQKFGTLSEKYGLSYRLTNPASGHLSRRGTEGERYRLEDRVQSLVEEFQERCRIV